MSLISELDDHCFVLATEAMVELCTEVENATGQKPTIDELCELLTWGLRGCSADILSDANPVNVLALQPKMKRRGKVVVQPGDIVAIPASGGLYYLVIFITKNTFGHAFGVFQGRHALKPPAADWKPDRWRLPIYTGDRLIASGRWLVVANRKDLLQLFPGQPEAFYDKEFRKYDDRIGPFGSAESPSGTLRALTKEEAESVGLIGGTYERGLLGEEFEALLEEKLGNGLEKPKRKSKKP